MIATPSVASLLDLTGRVALVTGASGTIGGGIARRLHEAGASVVVHAHTRADRADALVAELGARATAVTGDVVTAADDLVDAAVSTYGRLDIVVANAGIQPPRALTDIGDDELAEVLRVNVGGPAALVRAATPHLPSGGAIVAIGSIEGLVPAPQHAHYAASKAALHHYVRAAAAELGERGVRVNAVAPGLVHRDGLDTDWPQGLARWRSACPLGSAGTAADVADAVLFLAAPASRWISGAVLPVDGGMHAQSPW